MLWCQKLLPHEKSFNDTGVDVEAYKVGVLAVKGGIQRSPSIAVMELCQGISHVRSLVALHGVRVFVRTSQIQKFGMCRLVSQAAVRLGGILRSLAGGTGIAAIVPGNIRAPKSGAT